MTSCLQITDTGFARRLKVHAVAAKMAMRQRLKAAAKQTGTEEALKCGSLEILQIIHDALARLQQETKEKNLVLAEGLRNGHLAYRPDWEAKCLQPTEGQAWRKGLPQLCESHRLQDSWSKDRLRWRDADGVPFRPVLADKDHKGLEDYADNAAVAGPHEVTLKLTTGEDGAEVALEGPKVSVAGQEYKEESFGH